jgi:antitoxin YqcF
MQRGSNSNLVVYRRAASAFGGHAKVIGFWDGDHKNEIDVLHAVDAPQPGVTCYSTIGVSDSPLYFRGKEYEVRLELAGACSSDFNEFPDALSTAAFSIINSGWFCGPGVIFPEILAPYNKKSPLKHLFFVPPFLWEDLNTTLELPDKKVTWLLAVPITTPEMEYAEKDGPSALEDLFEAKQIDIFDPNRKSVVK